MSVVVEVEAVAVVDILVIVDQNFGVEVEEGRVILCVLVVDDATDDQVLNVDDTVVESGFQEEVTQYF